MTRVLSTAQIQNYQRDGYVSPINVFSSDKITNINIQLDQFKTKIGGKIAGRYNQKPHLLSPWINSIVRDTKVLDAVEDILGPNIFCWASQFFAKDAGDNAYVSWHQDGNYWGLSSIDVVTAWIALTPSTIESGCMNVVPGSQNQRVQHVDTFAEDNLLSRGQEIAVEVNPKEVVPIILQPGQMSLHHVMIFHGSEPNLSRHPRIGFAVRYMPTHVKQTLGEKDSALLVRGVDNFNYFDHESDPIAEFDEKAIAQHKLVIDRQLAILYSGAKKKKLLEETP